MKFYIVQFLPVIDTVHMNTGVKIADHNTVTAWMPTDRCDAILKACNAALEFACLGVPEFDGFVV